MRFWTSKWQWQWHWQFNGRKGWSTLFLLDKGTGSEVTSPTSHSYRSDAITSFSLRGLDPPIPFGKSSFVSRTSFDASSTRQVNKTRLSGETLFPPQNETVKSEKSVNTTPWLFTSSWQHRILNGCEMANHTSNVNTKRCSFVRVNGPIRLLIHCRENKLTLGKKTLWLIPFEYDATLDCERLYLSLIYC